MKPPIEFVKKDNKKNILVFIHGFTSDSETWVNSSKIALPEMLLGEDFINENFDVGYFNYFTKVLDFSKARFSTGLIRTVFGRTSKSKKNIGIKNLSDHLKSSLELYCQEYENIVLIAHSMGGLISKAFILDDLNENDNTKVKLFLSLAVPHKGTNWANMGGKLARKNPQIIDLKPLSSFLDKVNDDWIQQKNCIPKTVYYYGQFDEIVEEQNAISFQVGKKLKVACNYDHFDICKPESTDSIVYRGIRRDLDEFVKELMFTEEMKPQKFINDGKLDDEIFVLKLLIADIHKSLIEDSKQTFFNAEYMVRALVNKGYSLEDLNELYINLERLYRIFFIKFIEGEIKTSNELVVKIFENIIDRDKEFLQTTIPLIDANKKTGMLQQLANSLDNDIWWAKDQSIKDIDHFRKARDINEK
ncbi:hypothetical protein P4T79_06530 [Bacillus mojavensis]|uniref:ABC-three component system protein n=1 Tax=Bacillus mojavensis TaxID=72360 RepID=UPI002DB88892|nr:ABC-three component system protein [Bacillus mojavensis]MEC1621596.1 hypothetical protein [Bacillus mojavensis]MEC1659766.1 hypothetical protein [Bacillus mojavensis]MEC1732369.1 hypothetical protein [Bacillus mojavensis]MED1006281.1 hypothetical protein [Bacillus mojavensis]